MQWHAMAKAAKLGCACSQDFTMVAVYLVVQMDILNFKGSLLWADYPSLDSQQLTMDIKVSKSCHNQRAMH